MKENLIFGADILNLGACPDGKTDCSKVFNNALSGKENLISVPYGTYLLNSPIYVSSNKKLDIHPGAKIIFDVKNAKNLFSSIDGSASIIISGGVWQTTDPADSLFYFSNTENIKLCNCTITTDNTTAISFKEVKDFRLENIKVKSLCADALQLSDCSRGTVRNLSHSCSQTSASSSTVKLSGQEMGVFVTGIKSENASCIIDCQKDAAIDDVQIFDVSGHFYKNAVKIDKSADIIYMLTSNLCLYASTTDNNASYFELSGKLESLIIENFKREMHLESLPKIPTLKADNTCAGIIIDGLMLDEIISSKAASKIESMLPARLSNPHGKFIYTLETSLTSADSFIIPGGDFSTLETYAK